MQKFYWTKPHHKPSYKNESQTSSFSNKPHYGEQGMIASNAHQLPGSRINENTRKRRENGEKNKTWNTHTLHTAIQGGYEGMRGKKKGGAKWQDRRQSVQYIEYLKQNDDDCRMMHNEESDKKYGGMTNQTPRCCDIVDNKGKCRTRSCEREKDGRYSLLAKAIPCVQPSGRISPTDSTTCQVSLDKITNIKQNCIF